jgi:cell division septation protein DedD
MPDLSAYAVTAAAPSRRTDDSTMAVLYRAALGPVGAARYLQAFERFDSAGRTLPGWNWAAALCTLNWMIFRRLWGAALVYVAALEGLALLAVAVGHYTGTLPMPVLAGLGLAVLLAATVIPGLYGHAIVHGDIRKRITKALSASATLAQAQAQLARHAPTRRRLIGIAAINAVLALLLAALVLLQPFPQGSPATPHVPPTAAPVAAAAAAAGTAGPGNASAPASVPPSASGAAAGATGPASAASAAAPDASVPDLSATASASASPRASATALPSASAPEEAPAPAVQRAASQARGPQPAAPARGTAAPASAASMAVPPASASASAAAAASPAPAAPAPAEAAPPAPRASRATPAASTPRQTTAAAAAATRSPAAASMPGQPNAAALRKLYINVGLFAEPANARRAHGMLQGAGLPVATQKITAADGRELLRVRAGPFTSTSQANAAAARIRALGLETSAASSQRQ